MVIIKPEGLYRSLVGDVLNKFAETGLEIVAMRLVEVSRLQAEDFFLAWLVFRIGYLMQQMSLPPPKLGSVALFAHMAAWSRLTLLSKHHWAAADKLGASKPIAPLICVLIEANVVLTISVSTLKGIFQFSHSNAMSNARSDWLEKVYSSLSLIGWFFICRVTTCMTSCDLS